MEDITTNKCEIMKYSISTTITELANNVARVSVFKKILKPFYYFYKDHKKNNRKKLFRANALQTLKCFTDTLNNNGYEYTLAFGTLLGAVREKGFIKHDIDIDVAMWAEEWNKDLVNVLASAGFKLIHSFEIDNGALGREETYESHGITIDIFYFYKDKERIYCCDFIGWSDAPTYVKSMKVHGGALPRRIFLPMTKDRILCKFEDTEFFIPKNANEILEFRYGPTYMIPNPNWHITSHNKYIFEWTEKVGVYREF